MLPDIAGQYLEREYRLKIVKGANAAINLYFETCTKVGEANAHHIFYWARLQGLLTQEEYNFLCEHGPNSKVLRGD